MLKTANLRKTVRAAIWVAAAAGALPALADDAPGTSAAAQGGPTLGAYFDLYYGYNFNNPVAPSSNLGPASSGGTQPQYLAPSQNSGLRNFDAYSNQFSLGLAEISVAKKGKEVGFRADLDFGEISDTMANAGGASASGALDTISRHVGQAVVSFTPSGVPGLTVTAGKMYTHMGLEGAKAKDDWQYSRSLLFTEGVPYWHVGASVGYAWVPDRFATTVYLYNGWNNLIDTNPGKSLGFQAAFTPSSALALTYNLITGPEGANNSDCRTVNDLNATWTLGERVALAVDAIVGVSNASGGVSWEAVEALSKFTLWSHYYLAPRVEGYFDPQGFTTGATQSLFELTVTNGFPLAEGLEARLEARWDHSDHASFAATENQVTAMLGVLYSL